MCVICLASGVGDSLADDHLADVTGGLKGVAESDVNPEATIRLNDVGICFGTGGQWLRQFETAV